MPTVSIAFQTNKRASDYIALAKLVNQYDFATVSVYCDAPDHTSYGPLPVDGTPHHPGAARVCSGIAGAHGTHRHCRRRRVAGRCAQAGTYVGIARGAWLSDHGISEPSKPIQASAKASPSCGRSGAGNRQSTTVRYTKLPRMSKPVTRSPASPSPS
jgi:hypothetical protein